MAKLFLLQSWLVMWLLMTLQDHTAPEVERVLPWFISRLALIGNGSV